MNAPDPKKKHPVEGFPHICFLKNIVTNPNISVGDYTFYDNQEDEKAFEHNVLYNFPFLGFKLIIGKFCALARGVKFIMYGVNHRLTGISPYPFSIFGNDWERVRPRLSELPRTGDTVIGNDVWLGLESLIMPGVHIGDGSIISARSVVFEDQPPYSLVAGNPATLVRRRFPEPDIERLLKIAWWNWDIQKITRNLEVIVSGDVEKLISCK